MRRRATIPFCALAVLAARVEAQLVFEPALGRAPTPRALVAHSGGVRLWAREGGLTLALLRSEREAAALAIDFGGAVPAGEEDLCRGLQRFRGAECSSSERVYRRVRYAQVAPGTDLVVREGEGGFEYDLDLGPHARPEEFVARLAGHEALWIAPDGALVIETAVGALVQPAPLAWEQGSGVRLACRFRVLGPDSFGFELERRDPARAARIDPALRFGTYLTGEFEQAVLAVAPLPGGGVLAAGTTYSIDFPTTLGAFDPFYSGGTEAFVSCLSADGAQLLWSTLLGGAGDESASSLAVSPTGAVIVGGETTSSDFPTTAGALQTSFGGVRDVYVARLAPDGSALEWSTLLGGSAADRFGGLALAAGGEVVLAGGTRGGLPASAGAFDATYNGGPFFGDAFAARLSADGSARVWLTYLGGSGDELAERVALDAAGGVVLAGSAYAASFPTTSGAFDRTFQAPSEAWIARFDASGAQLVFSTLLGGSAEERVLALAVEPAGTVLCAGETLEGDFPLTANAFDYAYEGPGEAFLTRLAADGSALLDSTFFGGNDLDRISALAFDSAGRIVLGGDTLSDDLPTTPGAYDSTANMPIGGIEREVFIARLPATLTGLETLTYFGSSQGDALEALALDANDEVLFGGVTRGPGLPTSAGAFQPSWNVTALTQGYVARLALLLHPIPYGVGKLNSGGSRAQIRWSGFPSISDADFRVGVDLALPNVWTQVFRGLQPANWPFAGSRLRVRPPFTRYTRFKSDFLGYGMRDVALEPWLAGQTVYFQVWYEDPLDPAGAAVSDALRVLVHP